MLQVSRDLRAEADELHALLGALEPADWSRPTPFHEWTPWDVVAHLHFFDRISLLALNDPVRFAARRDDLTAKMVAGVDLADQTRREYAAWDPRRITETWIGTCHELAEALGRCDPKRRLPWFGPDMGVPMFTTARYMETWAHGQDVYDLLRRPRTHRDRIRNIAVIGVKTFAWTFLNRGEEIPGPPPYVRLVAPSGATWEWNEPDDRGHVRGPAVDFCQVVTQVRNVADTALEVHGPVATRWMSIAQCFAGGPADPPEPGTRTG